MAFLEQESVSLRLQRQELAGRRVLIIVENLPVPFDRRVWQEARTLKAAGATVFVICPSGKGCEKLYEEVDGVEIYRYPLLLDASGPIGYMIEYVTALFFQAILAWRIFLTRGLDVIQGCNPPDLIFLVWLPFRIFGVRYIFDHHDINPELYEAKFGRRGIFWRLLVLFEKLSFKAATVSIATNDSYRAIALERGGLSDDRVFVVRSGPDLSRLKVVEPGLHWKNDRQFLIGYVGVMGDQEGIDLLIDAVDYIVNELSRDDIQFCLVGGGTSLDSFREMSVSRGLGDYITFTGRAPDSDLIEVLSTMDVGVNPDRVNPMNDKSTMNKILEYMAFGKPIVQFDVVEGRFSARNASLYAKANDPIDLAEKLLELIADPERCALMGAYGRARIESELSWNHQVEPLLNAYQKALEL